MTTTLTPKEKNAPIPIYESGIANTPAHQTMELSDINIDEAEEEYILYATAAGLRREDFYVSVHKKIVTIIAGAKEEESYFRESGKTNLSEHVRTLTLPDDADPLLTAATYSNGSLEIHIPKGENTEEKPLLIYVY